MWVRAQLPITFIEEDVVVWVEHVEAGHLVEVGWWFECVGRGFVVSSHRQVLYFLLTCVSNQQISEMCRKS